MTRDFADVLNEALGSPDTESRVLVMSSGGCPEVSHGGGIKLARAQGRVAGVPVDGRLRDFDELRTYDLATRCRGTAVRWSGDAVAPHAAIVPVEVGGVSVFPATTSTWTRPGEWLSPETGWSTFLDVARAVKNEDVASLALIYGNRAESAPNREATAAAGAAPVLGTGSVKAT